MIAKTGVEVELKFRLPDARTGDDILAAASLGEFRPSGAIAMVRIEDRYVDTDGWALRRAGYAARLRTGPDVEIVSLKSTARSLDGRVHHRRELEGPAGPGLDPAAWAASDARDLLLELVGGAPLVELVTLRQFRRQRRFASGRADVELSVDEVQVVHGGRTIERFTELEGELVSGDARALSSLGEILAGVPGIADAASSKLDAALTAIGTEAPDLRGPAGGMPATSEPVVSAPAVTGPTVAEPAPGAPPEAPQHDGATAPHRPRHIVPTTISVASPRTRAPRAAATAAAGPLTPKPVSSKAAIAEPALPKAASTEPTVAEQATVRPPRQRPAGGSPERPAAPDRGTKPAARTARRAARAAAPVGSVAPAAEAGPTPEAAGEVASAPRPKRVREPRSPGVRPDDTVTEAGRKTLAFHLARMQAREAGTRAGDVEELHQMRVATRRMRAAWRVFADGFDPRRTRRHRSRLRRVARMLGAVRDVDVLLEGFAAYRAPLPATERASLEPLAASWARDREGARKALLRELDGDPYRRWLEAYVAFAATPGAGARPLGATDPQRVRDTAPPRIWDTFARVRAYEPVLRWADIATLHELRIAGKWLRYTLEFHEDVLGTDTKPVIARVTALQDHLGLLNDADVAAGLIRAFLVERGAGLSEAERAATGRYLASREREIARLRRGVSSVWRGVAGLAFRRRLGRLVADL